MSKPNSETQEQKKLIQAASKYPWGQFLFHIPNESIGGIGWLTRNRQMGMRPGVPDLFLPIPMGGYHGLFIEMKTATGRTSEHQKRWIKALNTMGYKAVVCRGAFEALRLLKNYMEGKNADNGETVE